MFFEADKMKIILVTAIFLLSSTFVLAMPNFKKKLVQFEADAPGLTYVLPVNKPEKEEGQVMLYSMKEDVIKCPIGTSALGHSCVTYE